MTGEKKSSESTNRLSVKNGKKLLSRSSKPSSSTISSPPKAAIAASNAKKDDVHRRRNLNDILRRRSGDATVTGKAASIQDVALHDESHTGEEGGAVDARMADRVGELERALSLAREEQNALREALEGARQRRLGEQGASNDVQQHDDQTLQDAPVSPAIISASPERDVESEDWSDTRSNRKSFDTPTSRPPSSHARSHDDLLRQNHDLRYKLAHLQDQLVSQDTTHRKSVERTLLHNDVEWNDLRSRLHATEKESQERLQQLLSLKSSISSLTRSDAQVTDSELADAFDQLANRIREWVISNFRRTKLDVGDLPAGTIKALRALTPAYEAIENMDRLALYQAIVSNALMQIFEEAVVIGLSVTGPLGALRAFAQSMNLSGTEHREWRRVTVRLLESKDEVSSVLQQGKNEVLHRIREEIAHLLFTLTNANLTPNAQVALMGILNTAADLQRTLALQKAQYQVLFFHNADSVGQIGFDERRMESVNDMDSMVDDDMISSKRQFLFCVFPCLEKSGDEWGENQEFYIQTTGVCL
ncbi:hypothetical protein CC86DRAFT_453437 [Ophiobolus disseminans]|uniref:Uncharacterized protein n=1 Tax=Ophiobolus disseminans TaxID=1469910 RepID=A0A6A7AAY6_9PLEO|nr:hypothetical protein CC86DRAFT_453437 [Ophiobolus disseminans]